MAAIASESETPDVSTESGTESTADAAGAESFHYQHDPMENPKAARDIVVNPEAVYGYSPSPDSVRLKQFVDYLDWTNKDEVEAARREREEYHEKEDAGRKSMSSIKKRLMSHASFMKVRY